MECRRHDHWTHPHDPDITKMKEGRTGTIVGVAVQDAVAGDAETSIETLITAPEQITPTSS